MPVCANPDCRIEFFPNNRKQLYCSLRCRNKKHIGERQKAIEAARVFTIRVCANPDCGVEFKTTDSRKRYCSKECLREDLNRKKRRNKNLLTRECANPDCDKRFETYNEEKKYCSVDCRVNHQNRLAREKRIADGLQAANCSRCGERAAMGHSLCRRCKFELEADRECRRHQWGWSSSVLKGFLSDPYQRESFWARWEGAHRPNFARGF